MIDARYTPKRRDTNREFNQQQTREFIHPSLVQPSIWNSGGNRVKRPRLTGGVSAGGKKPEEHLVREMIFGTLLDKIHDQKENWRLGVGRLAEDTADVWGDFWYDFVELKYTLFERLKKRLVISLRFITDRNKCLLMIR